MDGLTLIAGCGDVGTRLACRLVLRGVRVLGLRRSSGALPAGVEPVIADLGDPASLARLPRGITRLVYLPAPDARTPQAYRRVYVEGLDALLDRLVPATLERALLVTSSAVYGEHAGAWVDEDTLPAPPGFNGAVLLEAEALWRSRLPDQPVLRLAGLYGPGRARVLDELRAGRARAPRAPPFYVNRMHVDDAAAALDHLLSLSAPAPLYLGCDDMPLPQFELYASLAGLLGAPVPGVGPAPAGIGNKRLSNARLRASGFAPLWTDARRGYAALIGPS
jgi:nucleoside-diphosphate-sugar epimerase